MNGRSNRLLAWDLTHHQIAWQFNGEGWFAEAPLRVDKLLYVRCRDNYLYALNWRTGEKVWACYAPDGFSSNACVKGDFIYIGCKAGKNQAALWVIDRHTGTVVNHYAVAGRIYGCPIRVGEAVYFGTDVHAAEGQPRGYLYRLEIDAGLDAPILASPHPFQTNLVVSRGLVIAATKYGLVYFIHGEKRAIINTESPRPLTNQMASPVAAVKNVSPSTSQFEDMAADCWQRGNFLQAATFYDLAGESEKALAAYKRLLPSTFTPAMREFVAELAISLEDWLFAAQLYTDLGNERKAAALSKTVYPA